MPHHPARRPATTADFAPTADWSRLRLRARLLGRTRRFFEERGFLEVETPLLSADVVVDRHIEPLSIVLPPDPRMPGQGPVYWLQTSPEFGMKRLLAAGGAAIYQVARAFRAGERGPLHNPEFTLVEWYRVGDDYQAGRRLLSDLVETLLERGAADELSYGEAFARHIGIDPHRASANELAAAARAAGITAAWPAADAPADTDAPAAADQRDLWLDLLLVERVAPHLGRGRPTIMYDFPASQASLAQVRGDEVPVAERFELFVDGIELANGYHELLDPAVLRERNRQANRRRAAAGLRTLPEESRLLAAMEAGLPPAAGVALGFDRLVMLAAGASSLDEVLAFPIERA